METENASNATPIPGTIWHVLHKWGGPIVTLALFVAGAYAMHRLLASVDIHTVLTQLRALPYQTLALAFGASLLGYASLIGYDWSALRYIGKSIPLPILGLGSFTAYALSNTIGLAVFSGGAVRYRFYSSLGLDAADIAVVSSFCALSFGVGVTTVGLVALSWHPAALETILPVTAGTVQLIAIASLVLLVLLGLWSSVSGHSFSLRRFKIGLPKPSVLAGQILFSVLDIGFAASTLYILLPADASVSFPIFVAAFAAASLIGVLSHVPGGVGVFEGVMVATLSSTVDPATIAASLIAYRVIYYLVPFGLAIFGLTAFELVSHSKVGLSSKSSELVGTYGRFVRPVVPVSIAALMFITGAALLVNGLIPLPKELMCEIEPLVPLGLLEFSTAAMGALGIALVLLSNAMRRRLKSALWVSIALLLVGSVSLLLRRVDLDLAIILAISAVVLFAVRREFYRSSKLSNDLWSPRWIALIIGLVSALGFVLFFAHKDTAYNHSQWWQFAFDANTPRALRVMGIAAFASFAALLFAGLRPTRAVAGAADLTMLEQVAPIVSANADPVANFVFTGDKQLLLRENEDAFIMYQHHGRSFVALGDPVGPECSHAALIDDFYDLADKNNCRAVFYQVSSKALPLYIDAGFQMSKLGEEAVVDLTTFGLEGPDRAKLRQAYNRAGRDGLSFRIVPPVEACALMQQLKAISDEWLENKKTREKSFSLGRFLPEYIGRFPIALVEYNGNIVAFANILTTEVKNEATIDLMRHSNNAPPATMDYLFIALMLALKAEGFQEFSLGMAPLAGLTDARHKRLWDHMGIAVSKLGSHFYNFEGLHHYKDKFGPVWAPRYLATSGGLDPLLAMTDINYLINGGIKGAISK